MTKLKKMGKGFAFPLLPAEEQSGDERGEDQGKKSGRD